MSTGNFAKDFPVAIGIAAGATIGLLILVCVAAHFGPRMCRLDRKERWLAPDVENTDAQPNRQRRNYSERSQLEGPSVTIAQNFGMLTDGLSNAPSFKLQRSRRK
ncbi:hypothetical protein F4801DRAFT_582476 [Xylaria longipes]|nr:hypothetical protein F4801DRAFT_582476 [Xylaria longipes]